LSGLPSPAFKVVIFDYDGTLFDTRPAIMHCIARTFEECGRAVPGANAVALSVQTGATLADTLLLLDAGLPRQDAELEELVATYRKLYRRHGARLARPFPGVTETLERLQHHGMTCAIVSNKGIEAIRMSLDEAGLEPLVDFVLGDEPGVPRKPDPAVMTDVILPRYAGTRREEILTVGDTELDILFARRAGMSSCWASYGYGDLEKCRNLAPDYEISGIEQLPSAVLRQRPTKMRDEICP